MPVRPFRFLAIMIASLLLAIGAMAFESREPVFQAGDDGLQLTAGRELANVAAPAAAAVVIDDDDDSLVDATGLVPFRSAAGHDEFRPTWRMSERHTPRLSAQRVSRPLNLVGIVELRI